MSSRFDVIPQGQKHVSTYIPLPLELIAQAGAAKQAVQDKAQAETESHMGKQWNRMSVDAEGARALKDSHNQLIDQFSNKDFNDPNVKHEWNLAKRKMAEDLGPDGAAGAQEANYNAFVAKKADLDKRLGAKPEDGGIDQGTYDYILNKATRDYQGIGEKGPQGYRSINFETVASNPNIDKQVLEQTANWKANKEASGYTDQGNGMWLNHRTKSIEYIDPNEIRNAILPNIMQKPENQAYAAQQARIAIYGKENSLGYDEGGNPVEYRPELKGEADRSVYNKVYNDLFEKPVNASAARLGYTDTGGDSTLTANQYTVDAKKHKLENDIVRFSTEGMAINPQKMEKSSSELRNNINKFESSIVELNKLKSTLVEGSPEWVRADTQVKWNEIQKKKREEVYNKANQNVNGRVAAQDKELFKKFGEWNPGDYSDKNYLTIINKMVKEGVIKNQSSATVGKVMSYLGSTNPVSDGKKLSAAYNRKNESIDNLLAASAENYTIQPNLITVDSEKELKTSKAIEELYNSGVGAWEVYDENGPIIKEEDIPKGLKIKQITEQPVDGLGYLFGGSTDIKDELGNIISSKKYYVRPTGKHAINEKIGKDLISENQPVVSTKTGEKSFSTSESESRYEMGLNMIYPDFADQVSEVSLGSSRDIQSGNKIIANIEKKQTAAGVVYILKAEGYKPGTYGSKEEILKTLELIK